MMNMCILLVVCHDNNAQYEYRTHVSFQLWDYFANKYGRGNRWFVLLFQYHDDTHCNLCTKWWVVTVTLRSPYFDKGPHNPFNMKVGSLWPTAILNKVTKNESTNLICGNKMPTRCNRGFYCRSYCLLNMFRAPLCPSSGAQEYCTVVAACGISCCGFSSCWSGVELRVICLVCRMLQHQTSNLKTTARNTTGSSHCIILLSSWWWA